MVASPAMPKAPSAPTLAHASVDNHGNAGPLDVMAPSCCDFLNVWCIDTPWHAERGDRIGRPSVVRSRGETAS